jgi:signal recognition particle subunit SEC65
MYKIITMEREFASGGNEIGRRVAKKLGIEIFDRTILAEAAKRLEIPAIYIADLEETAPGSIIFNLSKTALGGIKSNKNMSMAEKLFVEEKKIIEEIVEKQNCVIVGRCASYILKDNPDCLSVFVHADREARLERALNEEKVSSKQEAEELLKKTDKRRSSFYNTHTGLEWGDMHNFDVCLDSAKLGLDTCVEMLCAVYGGK